MAEKECPICLGGNLVWPTHECLRCQGRGFVRERPGRPEGPPTVTVTIRIEESIYKAIKRLVRRLKASGKKASCNSEINRLLGEAIGR